MSYLIALMKNSRLFFLSTFIISLLSLLFAGDLYLPLNTPHPVWLNVFFVNFTFMGDGLFAIVLVFVYFFFLKKKQTAFLLLTAFVLSEIIVQLIKNRFDLHDFKIFFEQGQYLFFSDGLSPVDFHSVASGHTSTAFVIAAVLILNAKNKKWTIPVLLSAILVAISRTYLAQDRIAEIVTGVFIGSASAVLSFYAAEVLRKLKQISKSYFLGNNGSAVERYA